MSDLPSQEELQLNDFLRRSCYFSNNYFAYYTEEGDHDSASEHLKIQNFVPTYDCWCLACGKKDVKFRCSACHSVFFCDRKCQKKAWKIHKKHCKRDLFTVCSNCGNPDLSATSLKCPDCPVKFCNNTCKDTIFKAHKDFDCKYFAETFNEVNHDDYHKQSTIPIMKTS